MIIAIEGMDGAGKTTQVRLLSERLNSAGIPARPVKMALLNSVGYQWFKSTLLRLRALDAPLELDLRSRLVVLQTGRIIYEEIMTPHEQGAAVVCDRYLLGGLIYLRSLGAPTDAYLSFAGLMPRADFTVVLRVPLAVAVSRCQRHSGPLAPDRLEHLGRIFEQFKAPGVAGDLTLDGVAPPEEVTRRIFETAAARGLFGLTPRAS